MYHPRLQGANSPLSPIMPMENITTLSSSLTISSTITSATRSTFNFSPNAVSRRLTAGNLTPIVLKQNTVKDNRRSFTPYLVSNNNSPAISPIEYINVVPANTPAFFLKSLDNSTSSKNKSPKTPKTPIIDDAAASISVSKSSKKTITIRNEFGEIIRQEEAIKDKHLFSRSPGKSDNSSESIDSFRSSFSSYKSYQKSTPNSSRTKADDLNQNINVESLLKDIGLRRYAALFEEEGVDLNLFLQLTDEDLIEIGVKDKNDRASILALIYDILSG